MICLYVLPLNQAANKWLKGKAIPMTDEIHQWWSDAIH